MCRELFELTHPFSMPTFLVIKNGNVVQTIRGANPPTLNAAVKNVVAEAAESAPKPAAETKAKTDGEENEETVSGDYTMTKGTGWKMSLNWRIRKHKREGQTVPGQEFVDLVHTGVVWFVSLNDTQIEGLFSEGSSTRICFQVHVNLVSPNHFYLSRCLQQIWSRVFIKILSEPTLIIHLCVTFNAGNSFHHILNSSLQYINRNPQWEFDFSLEDKVHLCHILHPCHYRKPLKWENETWT